MALDRNDLAVLEQAFTNALKARNVGDEKWGRSRTDSAPSYTPSSKPQGEVDVKGLNNAFSSLATTVGKGKDSIATFTSTIISATSDLLRNWNQLSNVGANFSNDLVRMATAAANSRVSLADLTRSIEVNGKSFAALGGNITRGAEAFVRLTKELHDTGLGDEFRNMGYTASEANDVLALYVGNMRTSAAMDAASRKRMLDSATALAIQMDLTAKLTGRSRQEQIESMRERQADASLQARMQLDTANMNKEQAEKYRATVDSLLEDAKSKGVYDAVKELIASGGVGPLTAKGAQQTALNSNIVEAFLKQAEAIKRGDEVAAANAKERASVEALRNQNDPNRLRLTAVAPALTGGVGETLQESYNANRVLSDSISGVATRFKDLGVEQTEYTKLLRIANKDIEQARRGFAPVIDKETGKAKLDAKGEQIYEDKGGAARAAVTAQIAAERAVSEAASSGEAAFSKAINDLGNTLNNTLKPLVKDIGTQVAEGVEKGLEANIEKINASPASTTEKLSDLGGVTGAVVAGVRDFAGGLTTGLSEFLKSGDAKVQVTSMPESTVKLTEGRSNGSAGTVGKIIEDFGAGMPVMLHGREGVVTEDQLTNLAKGMRNEGAATAINALKTAVPKTTSSESASSTSRSTETSTSSSKSTVTPAVEKTSYAVETAAPAKKTPPIETAAKAVAEAAPTRIPKFSSDTDAFISKQTQFGTDAQKAAYAELMSLSAEQTKEKKANIQSEIEASKNANKIASDARDALELKLHEEGKGIAQASAAEKQRYAELTAEMSAAHNNTQKLRSQERMFEQVAADKAHAKKMFGIDFEAKAAEKTADAVKKASADSSDALIQTAETAKETAKDQQVALESTADVAKTTSKDIQSASTEQSAKVKDDIASTLSVSTKNVEEPKSAESKTNVVAEDIFKNVPKNIADAAKFRSEQYTSEELESKKAGYERRAEKEGAAIKEKEAEFAALKKQFETASPGNEKTAAKLKLASGEDELRRMKEANAADLEQLSSFDLALKHKKSQESAPVAPKETAKQELPAAEVKEKTKEAKPVAPKETAKQELPAAEVKKETKSKPTEDRYYEAQRRKNKFNDTLDSLPAPFSSLAKTFTSFISSDWTKTAEPTEPTKGNITNPEAMAEAMVSKIMPGVSMPASQVQPTGEAAAGHAMAEMNRMKSAIAQPVDKPQASVSGIADLDKLAGTPLAAMLGVQAPRKLDKEKPKAETQQQKPATQSDKPKPSPKVSKQPATLEDVVRNLERLNTQMSELISQQTELMRKQIRATAAKSSNVMEKVTR